MTRRCCGQSCSRCLRRRLNRRAVRRLIVALVVLVLAALAMPATVRGDVRTAEREAQVDKARGVRSRLTSLSFCCTRNTWRRMGVRYYVSVALPSSFFCVMR